jgi:hypothetical protein
MMLRSSMRTAIPAPMPAFAAVLRSGWDAGAETGGVDVAVADAAVVKDVKLGGADMLGKPDNVLESIRELAVATENVLVEGATSFPTVAASVKSFEVVLQ